MLVCQPVPLDELRQHCTAQDCWMAIHGKVYNVSKYLGRHPGGAQVMLKYAGRDATAPFDDVGHSLESLLYDIEPETVVGVLEQQPHYNVSVPNQEHVGDDTHGLHKSRWGQAWQWLRTTVAIACSREFRAKVEEEQSLGHALHSSGSSARRRLSTVVLGGVVVTCVVVLLYVRLRWPSMIEHVVSNTKSDGIMEEPSYGIPSWGV